MERNWFNLNKIESLIKKSDIGLYKDDGLADSQYVGTTNREVEEKTTY